MQTADGKTVKILTFEHADDPGILSRWAKHFRQHYCLDSEIDQLRQPTGLSRMEYLKTYVFPSRTQGLGPSVRSADFAEILVADYFQFLANWLVPRIRYRFKAIPDESTKGTDILAFQLAGGTNLAKEVYSANDVMLCVEVKAQFSGSAAPSKLQEAIDHSARSE